MVATYQGSIRGVGNRIRMLGALLVVAVVWLAPSVARAQLGDLPPQQRAPRAREAMSAAQKQNREGNYELADRFYQDANTLKDQLSPSEQADLAAQMKQNTIALQSSRDGAAHLWQASELLEKGIIQDAGALVKTESTNQYLRPADKALLGQLSERLRKSGYALPGGPKTVVPDMSKEDYATIVKAARVALEHKELDVAEGLAKQAAKKSSSFSLNFWADSHTKVLNDVHAARLAMAAADVASRDQNKSGKTANTASNDKANGGRPVSKETLEARMLLTQGQDALNRNDFLTARTCAEAAKAKAKADPGIVWESQTPDQLLAEIQRRQAMPVTANDAKGKAPAVFAVDATNARQVLKEARSQFAKGQLEDANRLCEQVAAAKVSWGWTEDNPDKLRNEINAARQKADKAESVKLLAEARRLMAAGNFQDARAKAWTAKQLHGPYAITEVGDRPDRVLAEIEAAEAHGKRPSGDKISQSAVAQGGSVSGMAALPKAPTPADGMPASSNAMLAKQRAQGLLVEAHTALNQGNLEVAMAKGTEARTIAAEGSPGGACFAVNEETPSLFLLNVAVEAKKRIGGLVLAADDTCKSAVADAASLKKAADSLAEARRLSIAFQLDPAPVEVKLGVVQGRLGMPNELVQVSSQELVTDNQGLKMLHDAQEEMRAGRTKEARRLAEMAFDAKYGVQKQAEMALRAIDIEEWEQKRLDADRAFVAAMEKIGVKDYLKAQEILAKIDQRLLSDANRLRMREIAYMPEMSPQLPPAPIQLTGGQIPVPGTGQATASDLGQAAPLTSNSPDFNAYKMMSAVELDKWTKESISAQKVASDKAKGGDFEGAIEVMRNYAANLESSRLEPDQVAALRKVPDRYIQQYQQMKQQKQLHDTRNPQDNGYAREAQRQLHQQELDAQVSKLLDEYGQLMRDHKWKEAAAVINHAGDIEPENVAVQEAKWIANIKWQQQENDEIDKNWRDQYRQNNTIDPGPPVSMTRPMRMDPNRMDAMQQRTGVGNGIGYPLHDPLEQRIAQALTERMITLSLTNVPLQTAIEQVRALVGDINIVWNRAAIEQAGIHLDKPVTQNFTNINLRSAMNILLQDAGLVHVIRNQCITVTTEADSLGKLKTMTYSVADLVIPIESKRSPWIDLDYARVQRAINDQLYPNGSPYGSAYTGVHSLPNGSPVGSPSGINTLAGQPPKPDKDPNQTMEDLLKDLITNTVDPKSWNKNGGPGNINYYPLGMALVVSATEDIQEQIQDLLQALRKLQDLEVAIEMRLVSVSESFYERIGVNFQVNVPTNNNPSTVQTLLSGVFNSAGQINSVPKGIVSGLTPAGTFTPDLGIPINTSSYSFSLPPFGGYPGTLGADGGISMGLAFLSDIQVYMLLDAAQGDRRTNTMQAPKITVFNGQTAFINVGDELEFLEQITVNQVNGQTVFTPQQNRTLYGVVMSVTPVVSADRRFVRLNLTPNLRNLISASVPLLPVQQIVPQLFYDNISPPQPVVFQLFFQQPSASTISMNTTVVVPDGGTVLMGGLKTLVEGRNEYGPPILSKIPYLSRLFKNTAYGREAQSLMIMVTARIIINEEEEKEFLGEYQRIPR
jgi:Flp pilus assembly secretin CpaC